MLSILDPLYFEIGAFLVSLFCIRKTRYEPFKWFMPFLLFIVIVESTAEWLLDSGYQNLQLFNITIPIEHMFFTYVFYRGFSNPVFKKIAMALLVWIPLFAFINILFIQGFSNLNTNVLLMGSLILVTLSCMFFIDHFRRDEESNLLRDPMFWITAGVLAFNLGELSYSLFMSYMIKNNYDSSAILLGSILRILIYVLYTFIAIGLLCIKKPYRKV